ncbi:MAG: YbgA family protein, partial [Planctomycetota bacterium]
IREHFLTRIFTTAALRKLVRRPSMRGLVELHSRSKLLLMALSQKELKALGEIVANHEKLPLSEILPTYERHLRAAFARMPRYTSSINVLMHALGYFKKGLSSREKAHFLDALEGYRAGRLPLSAANSVVRSWIERFDEPYLRQQTFFEPFPRDLVEITDSGKGRGE